MNFFYQLLYYFQKRGFEVCGRIADRLGIRARVVRTSPKEPQFLICDYGKTF